MTRRHFLITVAATALAACDKLPGGDDTTTVQGIIDWLKDKCNFVTDSQPIIAVIVSIIGSFNAEAGAAAVVVAGVAKQVEDLICNAVKQQVAQLKATNRLKAGATNAITVIVNGVEVKGDYTGK